MHDVDYWSKKIQGINKKRDQDGHGTAQPRLMIYFTFFGNLEVWHAK
jgi:hypothetical protein